MNCTENAGPRQVFIVGMNGSGTTMLLDCLAGHSLLYGHRGETKVLPYFIKRQPEYGDLSDDARFKALWLDIQASFGRQVWPSAADPSAIAAWGQRRRSAADIFDVIMNALASAEGKAIWCEKTPMYVHHMALLARAYPDSRFIHVIRDGRDCAASFHRRWRFNPVRTAFRWKQAVRAGQSGGASLESRYYEIHYEALTSEPEAGLADLCRFLGVGFEAQVLKPTRIRPQMTGSSATAIVQNERRAEQYFDRRTLEHLEQVAGRLLQECGYQIQYTAGDTDPPDWKLRWWELMDDGRRLREAILRSARIPGSKRLGFLSRRIKAAVRQKRTLV